MEDVAHCGYIFFFNFFQRVFVHLLKEVKASGGCHGLCINMLLTSYLFLEKALSLKKRSFNFFYYKRRLLNDFFS